MIREKISHTGTEDHMGIVAENHTYIEGPEAGPREGTRAEEDVREGDRS